MSHKFFSQVGTLKFDELGAYLDNDKETDYVLNLVAIMKSFEGRKIRITIEDENDLKRE